MWGRSIVRLCSAQSNRLAQAWVALLVSWFDIFYCNNVVFGLVLQQTAKRFRRCEAMQYSKRQLTGFNSGLRRLPMSIYIAIYSWEHYDQPDKPDGRIPLSELVGNYSCQPGFPTTLCSEKNTHSHYLSYLCVDLSKNCSEYTRGKADSDNVEIRYSLLPMT